MHRAIRCCSTPNAPLSPPAGSSHPAGLARSLCWHKRPPTRISSSYPPAWKVVNEFNVDRLRRFRQRCSRQNRPHALTPLRATRSAKCRKSWASACTTARPNASSGGPARTPRATRGSRLRTSPIARRRSRISRRHAAWRSLDHPPPLAGRRHRSRLPFRPPPSGFSIAASAPDGPPAGLVGSKILYWWPEDGWLLGSVAKVSSKPPFSHVKSQASHGAPRATNSLQGRMTAMSSSGTPRRVSNSRLSKGTSMLSAASYGAPRATTSPQGRITTLSSSGTRLRDEGYRAQRTH